MEDLKFRPGVEFNQAILDKVKLELSICDSDIVEAYSKLLIGTWNPGDPLRMQIARSLKELVELLRTVKQKEKMKSANNCTDDSSGG